MAKTNQADAKLLKCEIKYKNKYKYKFKYKYKYKSLKRVQCPKVAKFQTQCELDEASQTLVSTEEDTSSIERVGAVDFLENTDHTSQLCFESDIEALSTSSSKFQSDVEVLNQDDPEDHENDFFQILSKRVNKTNFKSPESLASFFDCLLHLRARTWSNDIFHLLKNAPHQNKSSEEIRVKCKKVFDQQYREIVHSKVMQLLEEKVTNRSLINMYSSKFGQMEENKNPNQTETMNLEFEKPISQNAKADYKRRSNQVQTKRSKRRKQSPDKFTPSRIVEKDTCHCGNRNNEWPKVSCQKCVQWFHFGANPCCDYDGFSQNFICKKCRQRIVRDDCNSMKKDATSSSTAQDITSSHDRINTQHEINFMDSHLEETIINSENKSYLNNNANSPQCTVLDETETAPQAKKSESLRSPNRDIKSSANPENSLCEGKTPVEDKRFADQEACAPETSKLNLEEAIQILQIKNDQANIELPQIIKATISSDKMKEIFNFDDMRFINREYPNAIQESIEEADPTFPCSFNVQRGPNYKIKNVFCKLGGKCGGDCQIKLNVFIESKPLLGQDLEIIVKISGKFSLHQSKATCREIRGNARVLLAEKLRHIKPNKEFLDNMSKTVGTNLIHGKLKQRSLSVLQKLKSEDRLKSRTSVDPTLDLKNLQQLYRDEDTSDSPIRGFIHSIDDEADDITFYLYNHTSVSLHLAFMKRRGVTIYLDATGTLVATFKGKPVLNYLLVGEAIPGEFYLIAELVTSNQSQESPKGLLDELQRKLILLNNNKALTYPFCDLAVCDFSKSILQGYVRSLCNTTMTAYLEYGFKIFKNEKKGGKHPVVYICQAHLIKAFSANIKKKATNKQSFIRDAALFGLARLSECVEEDDFRKICSTFIKTFCLQNISPDEEKENLSSLRSKFVKEADKFENECADDSEDSIDILDIDCNHRNASGFFDLFGNYVEEIQQTNDDTLPQNKYYCPEIVEILHKYYMPYFMLWSRFMAVKTKNSNFERKTSAPVESQFNVMKSTLFETKYNTPAEVVRVCLQHFDGWNKNKLRKFTASLQPKPSVKETVKCTETISTPVTSQMTTKSNDSSWTNAKENWSRYPKPKGKPRADNSPRYFSKLSKRRLDQDLINTTISANPLQEPPLNNDACKSDVKSATTHRKKVDSTIPPVIIKDTDMLVTVDDISYGRPELELLFVGDLFLNDDHLNSYMRYLIYAFSQGTKFYATISFFVSKSKSLWNRKEIKWHGFQDETIKRIAGRISPSAEILHPLCIEKHWILLRLRIHDKMCMVYDSSPGETKILDAEIRKEVLPRYEMLKLEMGGLSNLEKENYDKRSWKIQHEICIHQTDGHSCGRHVLMNTERILRNQGLVLDTDPPDMDAVLLIMIQRLLSTTDKGTSILPYINNLDDARRILVRNGTPAI